MKTMADGLDVSHLPVGITSAGAVASLDGSFASAFIRATDPEGAP